MRCRYRNPVMLALMAVVSLGLAVSVMAQKNAETKAKELRIEGKVVMVSKEKSNITVQDRGGVRRSVLYDSKTKFTLRNKPSTADTLKEGVRVICLGNETEKKDFLATRVDVREQK